MFSPRLHLSNLVCAACLAAALLLTRQAHGQGTFTFLQTGDHQPLVSDSRSVLIPNLISELRFDIGFASEESIVPQQLLDSFSVTIQNSPGSQDSFTAILLTVDRSGASWVPPTPGMLPIAESAITRTSFDFPSVQPVLPWRSAYHVSLVVPEEFWGGPVTVYFDLADNQDQLRSFAFFSDPIVVVPEPSALWLLACGAAVFGWRRWRSNSYRRC